MSAVATAIDDARAKQLRMRRSKDIVGQRFGSILVVGRSDIPTRALSREAMWDVRCECGAQYVRGTRSVRASSESCSCSERHGLSGSAEYRAWQGMRNRCFNAHATKYRNHGGRGITVCARWNGSFDAFFEDMGPRPSDDHSIDRIDNSRGYSCGTCHDCIAQRAIANCRWATPTVQTRNTRRNRMLTHDGRTMCLADWAAAIGLDRRTLRFRLANGWPLAKALSTPAQDPHAARRAQRAELSATRDAVGGPAEREAAWMAQSQMEKSR